MSCVYNGLNIFISLYNSSLLPKGIFYKMGNLFLLERPDKFFLPTDPPYPDGNTAEQREIRTTASAKCLDEARHALMG